MGSSTGLYGCFIIDDHELINSLGQFEDFGPLSEKTQLKKRFCPDTGKELSPVKEIIRPAVPAHRRVVVVLMGHKLIDRVQITDPNYNTPEEPHHGFHLGDFDPNNKAWNKHLGILAAAEANVAANSKMVLNLTENEDWEDENYFWECFVEAVSAKATGNWSVEGDPWSDAWLIQGNNLSASSYGSREERCIRMADVVKAQPDIDSMKQALASFGLKGLDFSFTTIWYE